jgi:N-acetylmuramoyl-L-alanine amidase
LKNNNHILVSSPNFNERPCAVDSIIIHYTDMTSAEETLTCLCNPKSSVSAHYLIDEKGQVFSLVPEEKRAWHAGESYWQGRTDMNNCSVGIELANPGHSHGYIPFQAPQIDALESLCEGIMSRWGISSSRILGHSDVAPRRKQDPGHLFPWKKLASAGMGLWPETSSLRGAEGDEAIHLLLAQIGYETISPTHAILAFQRHFQQHKVDGVPDDETHSLIQGLLKAQEKLI